MKHAKAIFATITILGLALILTANINNLTGIANSVTKSTGTQPTTTYGGVNQPSNQGTTGYSGPVTITDALTDALNPATTRTDGTNAQAIYYVQNADGTYRQIMTSASNTGSVNLNPLIKTIWLQVKIPSGQAFYPAIDKMVGSTARLGTATWAQPDLSNLYSAVWPVDVTNLSSIGTGLTAPQINIPIQLYTQSTTANVSWNSGSYMTNTNHTGIGAGSVQNIEPMTINFKVPATAIGLFQFKMALNDTVLTDINVGQSYCQIPYGQTVQNWSFSGPNVTPIYGASTTTYQFNIATDGTIRTVDLLSVPQIGQNWINFNCYIQTNLPSVNSGITFTPSLVWMDMQSATNTITAHIFKLVA